MSEKTCSTTNNESTSAQRFDTKPPIKKLRSILVADDEHLIASGLIANVKALGYEPIGPAANGEQAMEFAAKTPPDLALLDIQMPGKDGIEVATELWEQFGTPTVIVTAYSDKESVDRCAETGVFGYLLKPVDPESLRVSITIAWSRAETHKHSAKRVDQLTRNLDNRRIVEQAKWKMVEQHGIAEPEAHRRLQSYARSTRTQLVEIAQRVINDELTLTE